MRRLPEPLQGPDFAGARCFNLLAAEAWLGDGATGQAPIYLEGTGVRSRGRLLAEFTVEDAPWPALKGRTLFVNVPPSLAHDADALWKLVRRHLRAQFRNRPKLVLEGEAYGKYWEWED